jgi:hypothetical protein
VADIVGRSGLRWLFVVDAASCLVCAAIVHLGLPADRKAQSPALPHLATGPAAACARDDRTRHASPWQDPALLALTAAGTVFALIYMLTLVALPLSLAAEDLDPASAGLVMAAGTLTMVLARPLLRMRPLASLSDPAAAASGFILMAAGLAGYCAAHSLSALLAPAAVWSIGNLLLAGRAFAVVTALAPAGAAARYLAVYGLSWGVATVVAPIAATILISSLGAPALWAAASALCLVMAAVQPLLLRAARTSRAILLTVAEI